MTIRRSLVAFATALIALLSLVPAADAAPAGLPDLTNIRVGRHATYDRVVLDLTAAPTYRYRFVDQLIADPSGNPVSLPGKKFLQVTLPGASAHDVDGHLTYLGPWTFRTPSLRNVRAVAITGDFERVLTIGIGMNRQKPVHLFTLTAPNRLVIDVSR